MVKGSIEDRLKNACTLLRRELADQPGLNVNFKCKSVASDTFGRYAKIARWRNRPGIEVWFDKAAGLDRERFWFGFATTNEKQFEDLLKVLPSKDVPKKSLDETAWRKKLGGYVYRTPHENKLSKPYIEKYKRWGAFFLGMYDWGGHASLISGN